MDIAFYVISVLVGWWKNGYTYKKKRPESALQGRFLSWVEWLSELEAQTGQSDTLLADA